VVDRFAEKIIFADGVSFAITNYNMGVNLGDWIFNKRHNSQVAGVMSPVTGVRRINVAFGDGHVEIIEWTAQAAAQFTQTYLVIP
jgi:prepilin-type processing-associated H-X9-DG protein